MKKMWAIFKKEMRVYFVSPLAYAFLTVFFFLAGLFFYLGLTTTAEPNLRVMSANLSISLLFLLPLLTMRHFAEERRSGSFELLMTAPIPLWSLILGKWLSSLALCVILLLGTLLFPIILEYFGNPDWGVIGSTYLGLFLCCAAFESAGLLSSSQSDEPVAGGLGGVLILFPFWLAGPSSEFVEQPLLKKILQEASFLTHLDAFSKGLIDSADCIWFVLFCFGFLFLTWRSIESRRWR
ncbi:MAG: ABC transporter permease subunit [Myxococcota bacterium]|nr:ABC transporter permease subunit [Myxococcota bacterium]